MTDRPESDDSADAESTMGRRDFIKGMGKFSALTPPAVTMLLHVSMNSPAVAASGGQSGTRPGWGYGSNNHIHTGPPGRNP
jgi:hypothetical protein